MGMEGLQNLAETALREGWCRVRMWLLAFLAFMVICLVMVFCLPAHSAQLACGPLPLLLKQLVDRYHEFVVMTATNADGHQVLVTLSDAGTFTVLLGNGKGACVVLAGDKAALDNGT